MKKSRLHLFAFAFAIILGVLFSAVPVAAAPVGKVTSLEGRIDITPAGAKEAVPAAVGTTVNTGDIIRAKSKSKAEVTFTDGNILRVGENSRVRVTNYNPEEGQKNYFNLFRGKTQTVVNNLKKGSTLEVHTPTAICGVRGTIFVSMYINGQSSFVFSRGAGYGYNINRPDRVVEIPTKVMMIVPRPDRLPLLRPASESEIDQHLKDTTPAKEGEKKEEAKEEEKKQADKGEAKEEKPAKEEAKKEEKKEEAKKEEPAKTDQGQQGAKQEQTTTPQATGAEGQQQQQQTGSTTETTATSPAAPPPTDPAMLEQQLAQLQQEQTTQQQQQQKQQEQVIEPQKDTTPPTITFTSTPPAQSDDDSATIAYSANEKSDFQYRIDNGPWQAGPTSATEGSTKIADLTEGDHTFTVKAADALGNTSEKSYSWKTDYSTGPEVTITPQSAVPAGKGVTDVTVNLASTDTTYRYKLDDGAYQETTDEKITLTGLGAGDHTLSVFGRNDAGKRGRETQQAFRINRYDSLPGKIWLSNDITSQEVKADIAGIADADWGSWALQASGSGTPTSTWNSHAGSSHSGDDTQTYWLIRADGQAADGSITGTSTADLLKLAKGSDGKTLWNDSFLGRTNEPQHGSVTGTYGNSTWSIEDKGTGIYIEEALKWYIETLASESPDYFRRWNNTEKKMDRDQNSNLYGLVGSTDGPWSSPAFLGLGGYKNDNNWRLWVVDVAGDGSDGSRFRGGIGGVLSSGTATEDRYPLEGLGRVIYIREVDGKYMTGYLNLEDLAGDAYGAIGMWRFTGSLKGPGDEGETQYKPSELDGHLVESAPLKRTIAAQGGSLQGRAWTRTVHLEDQTWKLYRSEMGGTYNGPPVGVNTGGIDMNNGREVNYSLGTIDFQKWEDETGLIKGTMESKQLSWKYQGTASGSLIGDRNDSGGWEALASGVQRSEKLAFASLIGQWGQDGSIKRRPLVYSRQPIYTQTKVADVTAPIRIEVSPASGYESHTWIAPSTGGDKTQYFPVFPNNTGLKTYVKTPYPSARYEKGDSYERIRYFLFRKGDNYFSVKAPGDTGGFDVTVYDADNNKIDQRTVSSQSGVSWYNLYRLEVPSDPADPTSLWLYVDESGNYTALGDRPIIDYEVVTEDGGIQGILGGTQSLFAGDGKDIPVRLMGSYTGGLEFNRTWSQTLAAYDSDSARYVTYDQNPGTYFGVLGGTLRPEAEKTEGVFHALIIGADGKAGLFRGSFGKDGTGAIYPHLLIQEEGQPDRRLWEADGSLSRYDLGVASGIDPADLTGPWFQIQDEPSGDSYDFWEGENSYLGRIHASTWDASRQMHAHSGGFLLEGPSYRDSMWARQDYFDLWHLVKDAGANLGVFSWRSLGAYTRQSSADRWIFDAEFEESHKGNSSFSAHLFSFGTFGDEPSLLKGRALGYFGSGQGGLTAIAAGDTVGTYNEGSDDHYRYDTFTAVTTGTWLNTQKYLELMGSEAGRAILDGLGYPTQEVALDADSRDLTGALASKPDQAVTVNGFRIFSPKDNDLIKVFASQGLTSQATYATDALYPVTGQSPDYPVFGVMRSQYKNTEDSRWLGSLEGFGVFKKGDGTIFQGNFNGVAAGTYGTGFSGTAQGEVFESTLLSRFDTQLKYYQYASGNWSVVETGKIDGLMGSSNPTIWRENGYYPTSLDISMFGVWHGGDNPVHRGHIFRTESYPTNYTDGTTTTTTGHSYWGYLTGIHQVTDGTQDGIEALLTGIFLDKEKKVGFVMGQIGGPEAWSDPYGWGFDWSRQTFVAYPKETGTLLTEIASATTVTAPSLKDSILQTDYTYRGGVMAPSEEGVIGRFFDANNQVVGDPITMAAVGTATVSTVDDENIKNKLGVWSTELYGYGGGLPTHDLWIGMVQTPASDEPPTKLTGANIYGEPWQNGRVAGHVLGHWASLEGASGITFGRLLGTFDPSNYTYQAVMAGGFLETSLYLSLAVSAEGRQTLRDINIPCVQVGNVNLAGQNESLQVTMNDVKFFAFSTGQTPHLWATNSVAGQAKVSNPTGATVDLSGNSGQLSATFTMKNWDTNNNKWLGSVTNGQGRIDTPVIPNPNLQNLRFRGAAAGTINGNSFSGTAAGVVHKAQ
ncbi:MAG TPA: FecR domain-containing protein [Syntrophales bacterium]|nr:FecR domain-containing protein [Syntrophales bacterium]HOM07524.1 FecR domain-containing protein [Syntrophales bacterium]HPC01432.1 FecR domain-containing protein [Syntrophales bacterium]HPQ07131.1 FecR domain-containing protein [Syntrophales bacterium]